VGRDRPAEARSPVAGFPAWAITPTLTQALPRLLDRLAAADPCVRAELVETVAAVRRAGEEWARWRSAADGRTALPQPEPLGSSPVWLTTEDAADVLGVSANRIRQLCRTGSLPGRRVGGRWLVDDDAVRLKALGGVACRRITD
jgi:excisionase family DNA binding protein